MKRKDIEYHLEVDIIDSKIQLNQLHLPSLSRIHDSSLAWRNTNRLIRAITKVIFNLKFIRSLPNFHLLWWFHSNIAKIFLLSITCKISIKAWFSRFSFKNIILSFFHDSMILLSLCSWGKINQRYLHLILTSSQLSSLAYILIIIINIFTTCHKILRFYFIKIINTLIFRKVMVMMIMLS